MFGKLIRKLLVKELEKLSNENLTKIAEKKTVSLAEEIEFSLLCKPEEWSMETHYAVHKNTGIKIWIANGSDHVKVDGNESIFNSVEKDRIWKSYCKLKESILLKKIQEPEYSLVNLVSANNFLIKRVKELEREIEKMQKRKYAQIIEEK